MALTVLQMLQTSIAIVYGSLSLVLENGVPCSLTFGEKIAILMNVLYLVPLLGLFVKFFWKSYCLSATPETTDRI